MVAGSMMRHGVSNVTMTHILRDMSPHHDHEIYREATVAQLRLATNKRRRSALLSLQDVEIEGKINLFDCVFHNTYLEFINIYLSNIRRSV